MHSNHLQRVFAIFTPFSSLMMCIALCDESAHWQIKVICVMHTYGALRSFHSDNSSFYCEFCVDSFPANAMWVHRTRCMSELFREFLQRPKWTEHDYRDQQHQRKSVRRAVTMATMIFGSKSGRKTKFSQNIPFGRREPIRKFLHTKSALFVDAWQCGYYIVSRCHWCNEWNAQFSHSIA